MPNDDSEEWAKLMGVMSEKNDTDYYLFSGSIFEDQADRMIDIIRRIKNKRTNCALVLCTGGGNPDSAFQITRNFKRNYKKFSLFVFGHCKSAGTLVAVGANEIIMSAFGQFGPLDVQLTDKDELFGQTPALDVQQALATLSTFTFDTFFDYFLRLDPGRGISTKTAAEVAKTLALGIVSPISAQIDPLLLGRVDRSMKIAAVYMERLQQNFQGKTKLTGGYPSHSFVIDYDEAKTIFTSLREPDEQECAMENQLRKWKRVPKPSEEWIGYISKEKEQEKVADNEPKTDAKPKKA